MNTFKRLICAVMPALMIVSLCGCTSQKLSVSGNAASSGVTKDETVYVISDAYGRPDQIIVSDRLSGIDGMDKVNDYSTLQDIENVKGDETFDISYTTRAQPMPSFPLTYRSDISLTEKT